MAVNSLNTQISYEDALLVNSLCLFDGEPFGILDEGRIRSALGNQFQPYECNELAFASVYKSLILNHGFMNGNKRTAVIVLYILSLMIGNNLKQNDENLAALTYKIASEGGSQICVEDISNLVFSKQSTDTTPIRNFNLKEVVVSFINNHEWLMKELGK